MILNNLFKCFISHNQLSIMSKNAINVIKFVKLYPHINIFIEMVSFAFLHTKYWCCHILKLLSEQQLYYTKCGRIDTIRRWFWRFINHISRDLCFEITNSTYYNLFSVSIFNYWSRSGYWFWFKLDKWVPPKWFRF